MAAGNKSRRLAEHAGRRSYVPRICAHPRCGALALEVDVHPPPPPPPPSHRRRQRRQSPCGGHEAACCAALLRSLRRRHRLENPDDDDDNNNGRHGGGGGCGRPVGEGMPAAVITPAYSTQLVNAALPGPLASFGSAVFPCSATGVRKWERRRGQGQGTRFGDAEGRVCRGYGTVWWEDDVDDGGDDDEDEDGQGASGRFHDDASHTTASVERRSDRSTRKGGHFLRRSTAANTGSAGPLYCSEHLGMQYPGKPEKELRRIREFWSALEVAGDDDEIGEDPDDDARSKKNNKNKTARAAAGGGRARGARDWSRRMQAKQPGYWASLVERGLVSRG